MRIERERTHGRRLLYKPSSVICPLCVTHVLSLCVTRMHLGLDPPGGPGHREAPRARCPSIPGLPGLGLPPATVSPALLESKSAGPSGPVPTSNNGRISTASGLAISCSLPGCERLREEGASTPRGQEDAWKCLGYGTWDRTLGEPGLWLGGRIFSFCRETQGVQGSEGCGWR